jgi:hypothetical protein
MSRRDWAEARLKVDREGRCRVCKAPGKVEAAHTIGRKYDPKDGKVRAVDIIPLCASCHRGPHGYDARRLSILEYLTYEEQAAAVEHVGILRALKRLSPE